MLSEKSVQIVKVIQITQSKHSVNTVLNVIKVNRKFKPKKDSLLKKYSLNSSST